jgi:hypothetical protein
MKIISATPVAKYVKVCNSCCYMVEFDLCDLQYRAKCGADPAGFYLRCPNVICRGHNNWVGEDEPDMVARCRIYATKKARVRKQKR